MNPFVKFFTAVIRVLRTPWKLWSQGQKLTALVTGLSVVLAGLSVTTVVLHANGETEPETTVPSTTQTAPPETAAPTTETTMDTTPPETTEPQPVITEKVYELLELQKENPETYGWIYCPNTKIDEVVMYSPDRPDYYLYNTFEGWFSPGGTVYIDEICSVDPESQVLQIYGHNMMSGTRFGTLIYYEKQEFWEENPYIYFTNTQETRTFEVICASFMDVIKKPKEGDYQFFNFVITSTEEEFNEHMQHFLDNAVYDTGVKADPSDQLLMLVTCHGNDERFIVLARETDWVEPEAN